MNGLGGDMWTDRRTDRRHGDSNIPPTFVCGGFKKPLVETIKLQVETWYDSISLNIGCILGNYVHTVVSYDL